ncbi:MAG: flagellar motor switch protein FliN [Pirellulales bacterium]
MADDPAKLGQEEIDNLLAQAQSNALPPEGAETSGSLGRSEIDSLLKTPPGTATAAGRAAASAPPADIAQGDIDFLLNQAQAALDSVDTPQSPLAHAPSAPFQLEEFGGSPASTEHATLELLRDVELDLKIELGRTYMQLEDVLRLRKGSVVPLDKLAGDPVDIFVNGRLIARGEVLVMNDNFCIRVAELVAVESARAG